MDKKTSKLVITASKPAEEGILAIIDYLKAKEMASGKKEKNIVSEYLFENSYAVATLIKHYYSDEVSYAVFDVVNTQTNTTMEHACAVLKKKTETVYFDINGKKTLDEMKKFVARQAKSTVKNVEVKEGYFYAITSVTNALFNEIERNVPNKKTASKTATKSTAKTATKVSAKAPAKAPAKKATKTPAKAPAKKVAVKKVTTKATAKTTAKNVTKAVTKPVAKKAPAKKAVAKPAAKVASKKAPAKKVASKSKK